ncbi:MAG: hypothetical protein P1U56_22995 [Saprospiraceae bacterium]|nr:hypothetical protein [Saprospiraceae bacterium]
MNRSFLVEDLRFPPTLEELEYFNGIINQVQSDNTLLNDLTNVLYFGEVMWEAPWVIRNTDEEINYTFIPIFDPTFFQVSHYFGIKDDNGTLTYQLSSADITRNAISNGQLDNNTVNSSNVFSYFDYNFGFIDSPSFIGQENINPTGVDDGPVFIQIDCIITTSIVQVVCNCGVNHTLEQIGLCLCNEPGQSCDCPTEEVSSIMDCWEIPYEVDGGGNPTVETGGTDNSFNSNPFIKNLMDFVDLEALFSILELANTPCENVLEEYYLRISASGEDPSEIAEVNCLIKELSIDESGGCSESSATYMEEEFDFDKVESELLDWIISSTNEFNEFLKNPVCDMIYAGYSEEEVEAYLAFLKISLENEPDPGYDNDNISDPYSAYNILNSPFNSNKVTDFLIKFPCIKTLDNLGFLLSKPNVVEWATNFLSEDCGNDSKTNYVNIVFSVLKLDDEFVPDRFSDLYNLFTDSNDDILLSQCSYDITPWINLASFVIPTEVNDRVESLGWDNQDIDASGFWAMESKKVNLDYHSVRIDQLPDLNGDGVATPEELFNEIKLNWPDYANGQLTVELDGPDFDVATSWEFFANDYDDYWNTTNGIKTIIEIDTESNPDGPFSSIIPTGLTDDAIVICSSYEDECCWVFSTVNAVSGNGNSNNGSHPVSGNRQFGLKHLGSGVYEFYIKAADRARISWAAATLGIIFGGNNATDIFFQITDKSWSNLTTNIVEKIKNPGPGATPGVASTNPPLIVRPNWTEVREKLKSLSPLNFIPCEN